MKRELCFKYCQRIHERLNEIDGLLNTNGYNYGEIKFTRIYAVGSFVKGKLEPNDLDLLICYKPQGRHTTTQDEGYILDKRYLRTYGIRVVSCAIEYAFKWLTKGMRNVHRLDARIDVTKYDVKIEIWPKFNIPSN